MGWRTESRWDSTAELWGLRVMKRTSAHGKTPHPARVASRRLKRRTCVSLPQSAVCAARPAGWKRRATGLTWRMLRSSPRPSPQREGDGVVGSVASRGQASDSCWKTTAFRPAAACRKRARVLACQSGPTGLPCPHQLYNSLDAYSKFAVTGMKNPQPARRS